MKVLRTAFLIALALVGACKSPTDEGEPCGTPPYFTVLPVALSDLNAITVVGGFGAPVHTLPTTHAGIYLARPGVTVRSPGTIEITQLKRVTYVTSPRRQGATDYTIEYRVCREVTGYFGHITTLSASFPTSTLDWDGCDSYSTADETVQNCFARPEDIVLDPGEVIGTAGMSSTVLGLDVGLLDSRVTNTFVSPNRFPDPWLRAICPWDQFDAASQSMLYSKLLDPSRPLTAASGTPRCGTMNVDAAGTAKGIWAEQGVTGTVAGNETRYVALADYPYRPQENLTLSLGPASLGATVGVVPRQTTGRANRAFEQLTADGVLHCYGPPLLNANQSWFVALMPNGQLSIERRPHAIGSSPCLADPSTWSFSASRVTMVR
jgi:hypothetical protein